MWNKGTWSLLNNLYKWSNLYYMYNMAHSGVLLIKIIHVDMWVTYYNIYNDMVWGVGGGM